MPHWHWHSESWTYGAYVGIQEWSIWWSLWYDGLCSSSQYTNIICASKSFHFPVSWLDVESTRQCLTTPGSFNFLLTLIWPWTCPSPICFLLGKFWCQLCKLLNNVIKFIYHTWEVSMRWSQKPRVDSYMPCGSMALTHKSWWCVTWSKMQAE